MRPFRIPIGLHDYTVRFRRRVLVEGDTCNGSCNYDDRVIEVSSRDKLDVQVTTMWHEYFHALFYEMGATGLAADEAFVETVAQNVAKAVRALPPEFY